MKLTGTPVVDRAFGLRCAISCRCSTQFLSLVMCAVAFGHCMDVAAAQVTVPQVLDPRMKLELFAQEPNIVTPTGATFDSRARLLVIESHTHQRPEEYDGPGKDRIRIVEDTDGDGKADRFRTFFAGTESTMSIRAGADDWIYVATRAAIFRIRDTDGDDRADQRETLIELKTKGDYPHNGLSGLALDGNGNLFFGMGENLGVPYRMIGADGQAQRGSGEGGVFRCDLNGHNLTRLATGFWNPFGICVDPHGRVFAVGNDADGRPPCRMVQVVETGDYGFQFRYGRSGIHPLQAWNGELPGTLPMMAGTGEAPCEIVIFHGQLYVASWGNFRIERYELSPLGATFQARREVVVQGDESFRPVAIAQAADGSLYFTDWVDKSYPVHGQGRIWRLSFRDKPPAGAALPLSSIEQRARNAEAQLDWDALASNDQFLRQSAIAGLARSEELARLRMEDVADPRSRLSLLQALRWSQDHSLAEPKPAPVALLRQALRDEDGDVRLYAVRWVADAAVQELRDEVERQLQEPHETTPEMFQATIATLELFDTGKTTFDPDNTAAYAARIVADERQSPALRALAVRMLPPDHESLTVELARTLVRSGDANLRRDVIRTLALSARADHQQVLAAVAADDAFAFEERADAVMGLARDALTHADVLQQLADLDGAMGVETARAMGRASGSAQSYEHPPADDEAAWMESVGDGGDTDAGWRTFFGNGAANCAKCHRLQGRGASVGPDLTSIAAATSRWGVLQSMLKPGRDIAPHFVPTQMELKDGRVLTGLWQGHDADGKRERFLDANGNVFLIDPAEIETRQLGETSIMPEGLLRNLSRDEIRNLLKLFSER